MADPFSILVANLNALGFFGFLLPWIFMFAVTYGLLAKAKFFEDTKIVGVISLVLAFFVVGFGGPWLAGRSGPAATARVSSPWLNWSFRRI